MRITWMDKYGEKSLSWDLMNMSAKTSLGLRVHGEFYTSVIFISTNSEFPSEVYIRTFQEQEGWSLSGMKYSANSECLFMDW